MRKLLLGLAATSALLVAGSAGAAINVSYWVNQTAAAGNATLANISVAALGAPSGTGSVSALNFSTGNSPGTAVDTWLGISTGANGGHAMDNTVFLFTGTTYLYAGANSYSVSHDDGLQINVDGIGLVLDHPQPTSPVFTPFTINAPSAGFYNFELAYGECCGGPAVLQMATNAGPVQFGSGSPEPATWGLMLVGFGGMGAMMRRRRAMALTA